MEAPNPSSCKTGMFHTGSQYYSNSPNERSIVKKHAHWILAWSPPYRKGWGDKQPCFYFRGTAKVVMLSISTWSYCTSRLPIHIKIYNWYSSVFNVYQCYRYLQPSPSKATEKWAHAQLMLMHSWISWQCLSLVQASCTSRSFTSYYMENLTHLIP